VHSALVNGLLKIVQIDQKEIVSHLEAIRTKCRTKIKGAWIFCGKEEKRKAKFWVKYIKS